MSRWYGNLSNRIMEQSLMADPEVGMGVTALCYSDRHAYTIVKVHKNKKRFWMTQDTYSHDAQGRGKDYTSNLDGPQEEVIKTVNGWKIVRSSRVILNVRDAYYDPHFSEGDTCYANRDKLSRCMPLPLV